MASKQEIFKVYKERGLSMGQMVEIFKKNRPDLKNSPITFAGRLDPLAEGLVLLLSGFSEEQKKEILKLPKEYECDFILGFKTDTYDILGIVEKGVYDELKISKEKIALSLNRLSQERTQEYPPFSSRTVGGKALHQWAREGLLDEIEIPKRSIEIFGIEILKTEKINPKKLLESIEDSISFVDGDFRQEETISIWRDVLNRVRHDLSVVRIKALVSSGTYVRGLVNSLGEDLGCGAVVYSIKRTKIGDMEMSS